MFTTIFLTLLHLSGRDCQLWWQHSRQHKATGIYSVLRKALFRRFTYPFDFLAYLNNRWAQSQELVIFLFCQLDLCFFVFVFLFNIIPVTYFSRLPKRRLVVWLGSHNLSLPNEEGRQVRRVSKVIVHEDFQRRTLANDIALLRLSQPANLTSSVRPVCLPDARELQSLDNNANFL